MASSDHETCPACGTGTAAERWCSVCGLDLRGEAAADLRNLASRLAATELELGTIAAHRNALATELARRRWAMVRGSCRYVRFAAYDFRLRCPDARRSPLRGRPLHHVSLLVHGLNVIRQPGSDNCALAFGYFCRHSALGRVCVHRVPASWDGNGGDYKQMALGQ